MGAASFVQSSFLGGEWSKFMQGRVDHPKYPTAMNTCLNGYPVEEGTWVRRPGTRFRGYSRTAAPARVIDYEFIENDPYTLEFTDGHLRMWRGLNLVTGAPWTITSGAGGVFNVAPANHGWSTGDAVVFAPTSTAVAVAGADLLNIQAIITVTGLSTFTAVDAVTGAPLLTGANSDPTLWYVARAVDFATPYTAQSWVGLRAIPTQSSNGVSQCVILHPAFPPQVLTVFSPPAGLNPYWTFTFAAAVFSDGPYQDPILDTTWNTSANTGSVTFAVNSLNGINGGAGFQQTDIGRHIRMFAEPAQYNPATTYNRGDTVSFPDRSANMGVTGAQYYTMYDTSAHSGISPPSAPSIWALTPTNASWAWGVITAVGAVDSVTLLFGSVAPLMEFTSGSTYQIGLYSDSSGYPACGTYYQGRLWLAGSAAPNRFDASVSNDTLTFSPSDAYGAVHDNSAVAEVLNTADQNQIYWLQPDHLGIIAGTLSGEFLIQASTLAEPITATSITANRVTKYGCANILPVRTGISLVFIQKYRRRLLEFLADVFTGKFLAPNLSATAKHLSKPGITEVAYQEELAPLIWARCDDGSLIGCTYRRISAFTTEEPSFVGWHRHQLGSNQAVVSITNGPSSDGTLDTLWMVCVNFQNNINHICTMEKMFDEDAELSDGWFLDDAVVPGAANATTSGVTFYGLTHLNGSTVSAFLGGLDCGDYPVANGQITVPFGVAGGYFTLAYLQLITATPPTLNNIVQDTAMGLKFSAVIGFTYTSQGQLLRPIAPQMTGAQNGPALGKTRRVMQFSALLNNVINGTVSFGTTFTNMRPGLFTTPSGKTYTPLQAISGVHEGTIEDDNSFDGMICWEVSRPVPAAVSAIGGFLQTQDK